MARPKPVVLIILDGWGVAPPSKGNALTLADTPALDRLIRAYPTMTLIASGNEVGLSWGEMGNSEVGHLNIGAGRVYYQTFPRINKDIADGSFFKNKAFLDATAHVKKNNSTLHLVGLVSPGNVHAAQDHLYALIDLSKKEKVKDVAVHAILDGRDAHYMGSKEFLPKLCAYLKKSKIGHIASMGGRFYAMDRDNRWDRIEKMYRAMTYCDDNDASKKGVPEIVEVPLKALEASYAKKVYDEEFMPVVIGQKGKPAGCVKENDAVIFTNFRPDRARELTKAFVLPSFNKFPRTYLKNVFFVTMAEYEKDLPVAIAYPPEVIKNCLAEVVSRAGLKQLHAAETEKYAHVTFFLNGTVEEPFPGEDRVLVPSPRVSSYDKAPEMAAAEIAKKTVKQIEGGKYDFVAVNFANSDMVGHTGDLAATVKAAEAADKAIGALVDAALARGGAALITADHGNGEELLNLQSGEIDKEHSTNPVPCIVVGKEWEGKAGPAGDAPGGDLSLLQPVGLLADVAPTVLKILELEQPKEMTGRALI